MDKITAGIGALLALVSLGSAFDNFSTIGLWPKLIVTGIAALLVARSAATWLAKYLHPNEIFVGFGQPVPGRSPVRLALFIVLLAACCALFSVLALSLTNRFTLQLVETTGTGLSKSLLIAPDANIDTVSIELPSRQDASCSWKDRSQGDIPRLAVQMIGWDSPTPKLHIDNFVDPQRIEVECKPGHAIRADIIVPARTTIYLPDSLRAIRLGIVTTGGLLWLGACFVMLR